MKIIQNILVAVVLIGAMGLTSCGGGNDPAPADPQQEMIDALAKTWTVTSVTQDNSDVTGDWNGFSIQLTSNQSYTTNSGTNEQKLVWPASGSYSFPDANNPNKILRSDGVEVILSNVTETSATLSFQIAGRNGRVDGLIGEWVFVMGN